MLVGPGSLPVAAVLDIQGLQVPRDVFLEGGTKGQCLRLLLGQQGRWQPGYTEHGVEGMSGAAPGEAPLRHGRCPWSRAAVPNLWDPLWGSNYPLTGVT